MGELSNKALHGEQIGVFDLLCKMCRSCAMGKKLVHLLCLCSSTETLITVGR